MDKNSNNKSKEILNIEKIRKGFLVVILLGIIAALVIIAFTFDAKTIAAFKKINQIFLAYSILAVILSWIFSALPFLILSKNKGKRLGFLESATVYLGGSFLGFITPFGSGLLPTQIYIMSKKGMSPGRATAIASTRATISSWLFVVLGLAIYVFFGTSLPATSIKILFGIVGLAAVWSMVILYFIKKPNHAKRVVKKIFNNRYLKVKVSKSALENITNKLFREIEFLSSNLRDVFSPKNYPKVFLIFIIEIIAWFSLFSVLPLVLLGFGYSDNFAQLIFRLFILFSLAPVSPTPGGSGVVELTFTALLIDLVPKHVIGLVVLIWRSLTYYLTLIVGAIVLLRFLAKNTRNSRQILASEN